MTQLHCGAKGSGASDETRGPLHMAGGQGERMDQAERTLPNALQHRLGQFLRAAEIRPGQAGSKAASGGGALLCAGGRITVTNGPAVRDAYSLSPITYVTARVCRSNSNSGERTQSADGSNLLVAAIAKAFHFQPCVGKNATACGTVTGHRLLVAVPCHQHVKELVDAQMLGVERCAQLSENIRSGRLDHLSASSCTLNAVSLTTPLATASCQ